MIKLLFVCHGNICRSPMAEFLMKDLVEKSGCENEIYIESAATSTEELGNPVYPPVRAILESQGIDCSKKRARQIRKSDYEDFDLIIGMDDENLRNLTRFFHSDPNGKIHLLMDYTDNPRPVADPWYTRQFEVTLRDVKEGCNGLLNAIK